MRETGIRRVRLRRRWRDTTTMLLSNPEGARLLLEAIAQLDRWAAMRGRGAVVQDDAA